GDDPPVDSERIEAAVHGVGVFQPTDRALGNQRLKPGVRVTERSLPRGPDRQVVQVGESLEPPSVRRLLSIGAKIAVHVDPRPLAGGSHRIDELQAVVGLEPGENVPVLAAIPTAVVIAADVELRVTLVRGRRLGMERAIAPPFATAVWLELEPIGHDHVGDGKRCPDAFFQVFWNQRHGQPDWRGTDTSFSLYIRSLLVHTTEPGGADREFAEWISATATIATRSSVMLRARASVDQHPHLFAAAGAEGRPH